MKLPNISTSQRQTRGYTIMEVMLAVGIITLLVGGIFQTQKMALSISDEILKTQDKSMQMNSFLDHIRHTFEMVPGNCRVNLIVPRSNDGSSDFVFKDYPMAFAWSDAIAGSKTVIMRTEAAPGSGFQVVILYLDEEATTNYENGHLDEKSMDPATGQPHVRRFVLLEGVRNLKWAVNDDQSRDENQKWVPDWPLEKNRNPGLTQLTMEMADDEPIQLIFWIPVVVQPQQFANASMGGGSGGGGPGGQNPPGPISVNPPPGGGGPRGGTPGGGRGGPGGGGPGGGGQGGGRGGPRNP